ncbi:hypothetical protein HaLaN_30859, partial [Haematococcus lacustris]
MRLYGAQEKALECYFKKSAEEEAAIESQKRWGAFGKKWCSLST